MQALHLTREEILKAAFDLIQQRGWEGWVLSELVSTLETPDSLVALLESYIGEKLENSLDFQALQQVPPKERLFEIILMRFEYLMPYKEGLKVLSDQLWQYPKVALNVACLQQKIAATLLKLAHIQITGSLGYAKEKTVMGIYLLTFHKWLQDETLTLESTMAFLDQALSWCDQQMERYS